MQDRKRKLGLRSGGGLLLAAAAASILALVFAGSGAAGTPAGVGCATDGKINGGGATLQVAAQQIWIQGFTNDICGNVGSGTFSNGVTNNTMVDYNLTNSLQSPPQTLGTPNGSGAGRNLVSCRAVPFAGSDTPYDGATLTNLNGNPGAVDGNVWTFPGATECSNGSLNTYANPFYGSSGAYPFIATGGTDAQNQAASDQPASLMSFPVTGTAVAVGVFFAGTSGCPTQPQLTGLQLSKLFNGSVTTWSSLGGAFAGCGLSVRRDVRSDSSGTTQNFKNYLAFADPHDTPGCTTNNSDWTALSTNANNVNWPTGGPCSTLVTGHISGNLGVLDDCTGLGGEAAVPGTICYADLPDFENSTYQAVAGFDTAQLPSATNGTFQKPFNGSRANCDYSSVSAPDNNANGAVGLDTGNSWALDNSPSHANVAGVGSGWPACAMTWDLVYKGSSQAAAATTQPNRQLNDDQRRSLYSYMLYVLGAGQSLPAQGSTADFYQTLPPGLLNQEVSGFKSNY